MPGFRFRARDPSPPPPPPQSEESLLNRAAQQLQTYTEQTLQTRPVQSMRGVLDDFYGFIAQGNVVNLAVGLILGASFTAILNSFVVDILTPVISLFAGASLCLLSHCRAPLLTRAGIADSGVLFVLSISSCTTAERSLANHFWVARCPTTALGCSSATWATWEQARDAGAVTINYGRFLENVVNFFINALFLFLAVKKTLELVFKRNVLVKKTCPYCLEFVKGAATRCMNCGSDI